MGKNSLLPKPINYIIYSNKDLHCLAVYTVNILKIS